MPARAGRRKKADPIMTGTGQSDDAELLEGDARRKALARLAGWRELEDRDAITRTFRFADFVSAFSFMSAVALVAERMDHHPEWSNVYNRVVVTLTTHSAGGVTQKDIDLALRIDAFAAATALTSRAQ